MMKLHRPLCSDVTLRLVVDISPDYDEDDEQDETANEANDNPTESVDNDNQRKTEFPANKNLNFARTNNNRFLEENSETSLDFNQNRHQHSRARPHNHSCSWYSRQNTSDKTAKDIYNHEHVFSGEAKGDNFQTVHLDSEFKRCVEEEGNDFKEASICQQYDNIWEEPSINYQDINNQNKARLRQYSDADLSSCLEDTPWCESSRRRAHKSSDDDNSESTLYGGADGDLPSKRRCVEDARSLGSEERAETGDEESLDDSLDNIEDVVLPEAPEELPVDCDEDVDVFEKQMDQSLITSFYGEISNDELGRSMIQSIHAHCRRGDVIADEMTKSIAEEIHDVILGDGAEKADVDAHEKQLPFPYPFTLKHAGHLFDKPRYHLATTIRSRTSSRSTYDDTCSEVSRSSSTTCTVKQHLSSFTPEYSRATTPIPSPKKNTKVVSTKELEVTHRGLHRFIPRHKDEMNIGIGDPIHVIKEFDDLWCEGINLRTGEKGIFPAMYANDLNFLEESDDEEEYWKFSMRFLGSIEVTSHKGDETLVHAINKVASLQKDKLNSASLSTLEINQYGIRMIDKSKEGHEKDAFSHFFALKNISFCGTHPKNNRYFAFITKHPRDYKFACHVFYGDRPTHRARDALGEAFKRFYQEYMAFTHPTEDIYME
ncbi:uncharacterized protein LOC131951470 isoform X2 [Physella acuta]|uniref:uncharacterized protein LOC131951470 isoform X2 n=1 Tax=Physella acuta TaxID=109671 RepID=UPI0027DBD23A|nr:uncharacterized protein LOC131951470 isoform X2 [Physella acuta]